ncbi:hypothetical protein A2Z23_01640 [Candidatus Curtissbacteria bacterium RBG_16_39_7]|uniref:Uncharacterized protein n=1 Tax=Candidatus Curtissbacteria bacterium RBG_16_39_7 TaxID=1797707 RepID=A0A1F5G505_9BACT|nr:MAG: hypothetical protein A2Z23_01640 [Candidatus Curtissbacteria bacterium RBG_16_39_7]
MIFFFTYLILPTPNIPPLPNSERSTEPGDTVQVPRVSGYYTNLQRAEVTNFYKENFSRSSFLGLPLPVITLNHPPEYSRDVIRDQILSSYLEEYIHPFRDSLYINGWEPDIYFKDNPSAREQFQNLVGENKYFSKVTLRPFYSNIILRIGLFLTGLILFYVLYLLSKRILTSGWKVE